MDQPLYEPDSSYAHGPSIVLVFLILMPFICFLPRWIFSYPWDEHKPRISKLIESIPNLRLQVQPRDDLMRFREEEIQKLQSYGWVNREAGLVRVPISEAMDLYLQEEGK